MDKNYMAGEKNMREAQDALKTGLFKWNKDYASAAIHFDEADSEKYYDDAINAFEKLIEVNDKLGDSWAIARNYEAIINLTMERITAEKNNESKKVIKPEVLAKKTIKAGYYFRLTDSYSNYINLVKKVGKHFEEREEFAEGINLYKALLNDLEEGDQKYLRSEVMMEYIGILIQQNKTDEATAMLERELTIKKQENKGNLDSLAFAVLCMYIIRDDPETAERKLEEYASEYLLKSFIKSPECDCAEKMIHAYVEGDQEGFNKQAIRNIVNHVYPMIIIKLLRKTTVKQRMDKKTVNLAELIGSQDGEIPESKQENVKKALDDLIC